MKHNGITLNPHTKAFRKPAPIPADGRLKTIASGTAEVFKLDPRFIQREPGFNPRYDFGSIQILAEDILENGILEALKVRKDGSNVFLVNGDRRLTAVEMLIKNNLWPQDPANPGYPLPVPCTSEGKGVKPIDRIFMMLSLNTGKPFTLLEKGLAYQQILTTDPQINASEIARRSGETKQAVSNALQIVNHGSPTLIEHIKKEHLSATTALEIIKATNGHDEQNDAAAKAIASANGSGRNHATPKDLPTKPAKKPAKSKTPDATPLWDYRASDDDQWTQGEALAPTKLRALESIPHGIAILELMTARDMGFWVAGYNLQTEHIAICKRPSSSGRAFNDEASAITAAWQALGKPLGDFCRAASNPQATLEYLSNLGTELTGRFPSGWDHDNSIFAETPATGEGDADPTAGAFIADLNDEDEEPANDDEAAQSTGSLAPSDPGAFQRLKSAPSSNRDGSSGGPGEGFATPDKRVKNIEKALDELDKDECDKDRWDTIELVLDYLNGNHTIKTIKDHLAK